LVDLISALLLAFVVIGETEVELDSGRGLHMLGNRADVRQMVQFRYVIPQREKLEQ